MSENEFTKKSQFICVEISIKTDSDAAAFVKWFEDQDHHVTNVPCDSHKSYIYCDPVIAGDANTAIRMLCDLVDHFPANVRKIWDEAGRREFDAGYHVGDEPLCFKEHLDVETLKAVTEVNACIGISLYPAEMTDKDGCPQTMDLN